MTLSIVHLVAPAAFGGMESVVLTLARGQADRGSRVTVVGTFTESPGGQPFWDALSGLENVDAVALVIEGRQYLAERRAVSRALAVAEADVLHTHGYRPDVLSAPVGRAAGLVTATTVHGFTGGGVKNRIFEWLQRRAYRRFDAVVAVSAKLEHELAATGVPPGVLHCVPNAWAPSNQFFSRGDARAELGLPEDATVVGWIGRMSPEKGPDVALSAFARLGDTAPGTHLSFIGDGGMRAGLESEARHVGATERVHWHGVVPAAGRYLKAFDAVLLSSWTEGTPIVLLEAMAAGVPVITTSVGGIPDVVSGDEAILVDAGDVDGLAGALGTVLANREAAATRAEAARIRLQRDFTVEPWVQRYETIYRSCLER